MAQLLNQTIKELRSLEPRELAVVHGMIHSLRRPRTTGTKSLSVNYISKHETKNQATSGA